MTIQEKADLVFEQNAVRLSLIGVSKEAFRFCFEKGYNFRKDEEEAREEKEGKNAEEELSAMYKRLSGSEENKCLLLISLDAHGACRLFFKGTRLIGMKAIAASCLKSNSLKEMLREALTIAGIQEEKEK